MSGFFKDIQPAVRKETRNVAAGTGLGVLTMWALFAVLHMLLPDKIPLDYTVFLGGLAGGAVAVLNFFLMGLTVQKVVSCEDEKLARSKMSASYSQRMMLQLLWGIAAIAAPCFQFVAGLLPLLFPGLVIKLSGILGGKKKASA
ncbi:MAG: hypothetical protein Q4D55_02780 [Eubacteriales bacterium]|nr:hypothetical protein [Eubacteriales bacterium]